MALTLSDIREEVNRNHGGRFSQEDASWARMDRQINLTIQRLARVRDWKEMFRTDSDAVTITGTPSTDAVYSLPSTVKELYALMFEDSNSTLARKLTRVPSRQWNQLVGQTALHSTGTTSHYSIWKREGGQSVAEWFRVPSVNYTLHRRYSAWPITLSDAGTAPELENKDDLIIADVTMWFFQSMGRMEDAQRWATIRSGLFQEAIEEDANRPDESYKWRGAGDGVDGSVDYWRDPFVRRSW